MYIDMENWVNAHDRVLSGRMQGAALRDKLKLDEQDETDEIVTINIPDYIWSVNSSYFLSCFGASVRKLGEVRFRKKYIFECDSVIQKNVEDGISRATKVSDILIRSSIWIDQ